MSTAEHIPALSYILEPALVVGLLAAGTLANSRRPAQIVRVNAVLDQLSPAGGSRSPSPPPLGRLGAAAAAPRKLEMRFLAWTVTVPDNARFRMHFFSRVLAMLPFLMECWYWVLTYWIYQLARAAQAVTMGHNTRVLSEAHARVIIALERALHIDCELALQHFVMRFPLLLAFFNKTYAMVHIPATIAFMGYSFRFFAPERFQATRRTLVLCNCLAFIIFSSWPCMPPRLLPFDEFGYVDTLHTGKAASIWTTNKFQNQLAAFPSLHFGYSFVIGVSLFLYSPHKLVRFFAPGYPVLILLVIMATANHYLLDAVGGFFVTIAAYRLNPLLLNLRPLEEWFFWALRTEKPMDKAKFDAVLDRDGGANARFADEAGRPSLTAPLLA
ncbi:hypothetical protein Q5752_000935 [Cryptotrichosporon argae]